MTLGPALGTLDAVAGILRAAFPDPAIAITTAAVQATVRALAHVANESGMAAEHGIDLDGDGLPDAGPLVGEDARVLRYYMGHALHSRTMPVLSEFTGLLPMVEVQVGDAWIASPIETRIGTVHAGDHKLYSFAEALRYYDEVCAALGRPVRSVDAVRCVTPARAFGARFAAIAVYLFDHGDETVAWALEAGMATGEARVLYGSCDGEPITRRSHYKPTPFSSPDHYYRGELLLDDERRPSQLDVRVLDGKNDQAPPKMRVLVTYQHTAEPECIFPALLTLQAACRVAAIAEAARVPFPDLGPLSGLFAQMGRDQYAWTTKPTRTP